MRDIISQLNRVRGRSRALLITQRLAHLAAWIVASIVALVLLDFAVRLPGGMRLVVLVTGLAAVAWMFWKRVLPALGFAPTLTDVALRVERAIPGLSGRLASSVEFASDSGYESNALAMRTIRDTESRAASASLGQIVAPQRARRDIAVLGGVLAVAITLVIVAPAGAQTGLTRLFLPLGSAQWPARTAIQSLMLDTHVHARGSALPLRAKGLKAPRDRVESMDIRAHYRLMTERGQERWRQIVVAHQGDGIYESLIDTDAESIEFYFTAADSATPRQTIHIVPPPSIVDAVVAIAPPDYAREHVGVRSFALGPGIDERSITDEPSLIGSEVELSLALNKPVPVPESGVHQARWLHDTLGWQTGSELPRLASAPGLTDEITLRWTLTESVSLAIDLVDEHGLHSSNDIAYRIDAVDDRPPTVTITTPETDQAVLPTALVPITAEARDDVAIRVIGLEATRQEKPGGEAAKTIWQATNEAIDTTAELSHELDLGRHALLEGDVVEIVASAEDIYELDGQLHSRELSPIRRLRIISERDFGESIFQELKALRENAIRLEGRQAELQDDVIDSSVQPGVDRAQLRIGERIAEQIESLKTVVDRAKMNRFEDAQIDSLVSQADDLLTHAGQASSKASEAIESRQTQSNAGERTDADDPTDAGQQADAGEQRDTGEQADAGERTDDEGDNEVSPDDAGERPDEDDELALREPDEADRPVVEAQQEVRDELRDLIELLDRNEDTWVMNQRIKDLLDEQTRLQSETQQLGNQTVGRPVGELSQAEQTELDRIRQKQLELAEKARDLIDDLRDRADDMDEVDPQAAEAQRDAANTGEQRELDRNMENAATATSQNQLQNAQNSQQRAREALEAMAENLDRKRAQAEDLMRRLASLIDSIKQLITVQEGEIAALAQAKFDGDFTGRDRAMIRLSQNTQAVSGEARAAGREADRIARALDRAADAQGAAVGYLRDTPIASDDADGAENRSLDLLNEALELAEELEDQTEQELQDQKREELIKRYNELKEREVALRGETLDLQEVEAFGRRELVEARSQANLQEEIRQALNDIRADTQEVSDSMVFSHVHQLMDDWSTSVSERLRAGDVSEDVTDAELSIARSLEQLAAALEQEMNDEPFEDNAQAGGGGGGGGQGEPPPLVPPIAELKLLRGMQELIYNRTRQLDERESIDDADRRQRLRELGREQGDLLDLGRQMAEQLSNQGPPPAGNDEGEPQ